MNIPEVCRNIVLGTLIKKVGNAYEMFVVNSWTFAMYTLLPLTFSENDG